MVIGKQRALSLDILAYPNHRQRYRYSCLQTTVVAREYAMLSTRFNTCPPYFKVESKITRDVAAQCSLFPYIWRDAFSEFTLHVIVFIFLFVFQRSTFVGYAWSFGFLIPATTANDLRLQRIFYPRLYPLHLFSYLNS